MFSRRFCNLLLVVGLFIGLGSTEYYQPILQARHLYRRSGSSAENSIDIPPSLLGPSFEVTGRVPGHLRVSESSSAPPLVPPPPPPAPPLEIEPGTFVPGETDSESGLPSPPPPPVPAPPVQSETSSESQVKSPLAPPVPAPLVAGSAPPPPPVSPVRGASPVKRLSRHASEIKTKKLLMTASNSQNRFWIENCKSIDELQEDLRLKGILAKFDIDYAAQETKKKIKSAPIQKTGILDTGELQKLAIKYKEFKNYDSETIIKAINEDNFEPLGVTEHGRLEFLEKLITFLPNEKSATPFLDFMASNGNTEELPDCEKFVLKLLAVKNLRKKLEVLFINVKFEEKSKSIQESIDFKREALTKLIVSTSVKDFVRLVVAVVNYLSPQKQLPSIQLSSLIKLIDTKRKDGKSILHDLQKIFKDMFGIDDLGLNSFIPAVHFSMQDINSEINSLNDSITLTNEIANDCQSNADDISTNFCKKIIQFACDGKKIYDALQSDLKKLEIPYDEVKKLYGDTIELDEFLVALKDFHLAYEKVKRENENEEMKKP